MNPTQVATQREKRFQRLMAERGITLIRPLKPFVFRRTTYLPDFYCPATGAYYEVIGSRARGWTIAPTLDLMEIVYPKVKLLVMTPEGDAYTSKKGTTIAVISALPFGAAVIGRIVRERLTLADFVVRIGYTPGALSNIVHGHQSKSHSFHKRMRRFAAGA